jgi:hypothetical protein
MREGYIVDAMMVRVIVIEYIKNSHAIIVYVTHARRLSSPWHDLPCHAHVARLLLFFYHYIIASLYLCLTIYLFYLIE